MESVHFKNHIKKLYNFVLSQTIKSSDDKTGDWKIIYSQLKNGDEQVVIYRNTAEINVVYNQLSFVKVELYIKLIGEYDPVLYRRLCNYLETHDKKQKIVELNNSISTTLLFDHLEDFGTFVRNHIIRGV